MVSPFLEFDAALWRNFRLDTPLNLNQKEVEALSGINEKLSLKEVEEIYLPLARLLSMYVQAKQNLFHVTNDFLGKSSQKKVPYIIGLAGSVAVGKSTTARILQALLSRMQSHPKVEIVTTDGFILPLKELEQKKLLKRKGFPESYNQKSLLRLLADLKGGEDNLKVPLYSHRTYDILEGEYQYLQNPDIVILEGLNVFQVFKRPAEKLSGPFVSDYFDFGLYVDAPLPLIEEWFYQRFFTYWESARQQPETYLYQFRQSSREELQKFVREVWVNINEKNLLENIHPFRSRADLILEKGHDHMVKKVYLRKI